MCDSADDSVALDTYDQLDNPIVTHGTPPETTIYPGPPPPGQSRYVWREAEAARTPARFRDRVLAQFQSPQNVAYLRDLFARSVPAGKLREFAVETVQDAIMNYSNTNDRAYDILMSDDLVRRGFSRRSGDFWAELRRLNRAFYDDRMRFFVQGASIIDPQQPHDGVGDADEDYAMSMFMADSLRPPGLEYLNGPGPLWALREDQSTWEPARITQTGRAAVRAVDRPRAMCQTRTPRVAQPSRTEAFVSGRPRSARRARFAGTRSEMANLVKREGGGLPVDWGLVTGSRYPKDDVSVKQLGADRAQRPEIARSGRSERGESEDDPWDEGNPNRTPEEALAEFWGDSRVETKTQIGSKGQAGVAYGGLYSWGNNWKANGGTRFMRYEEIPFWQKGGHEGYDYDIEETLGTQMRETDNPVRRWDMDRLRQPDGQKYRTYGPRSGPFV